MYEAETLFYGQWRQLREEFKKPEKLDDYKLQVAQALVDNGMIANVSDFKEKELAQAINETLDEMETTIAS